MRTIALVLFDPLNTVRFLGQGRGEIQVDRRDPSRSHLRGMIHAPRRLSVLSRLSSINSQAAEKGREQDDNERQSAQQRTVR